MGFAYKHYYNTISNPVSISTSDLFSTKQFIDILLILVKSPKGKADANEKFLQYRICRQSTHDLEDDLTQEEVTFHRLAIFCMHIGS